MRSTGVLWYSSITASVHYVHLCWWRRFISPHSEHKENTRPSKCDSIDGLCCGVLPFLSKRRLIVNGPLTITDIPRRGQHHLPLQFVSRFMPNFRTSSFCSLHRACMRSHLIIFEVGLKNVDPTSHFSTPCVSQAVGSSGTHSSRSSSCAIVCMT